MATASSKNTMSCNVNLAVATASAWVGRCMYKGSSPSAWQLCSAVLAVVPVHVTCQNDISAFVFIQHLKRLQTVLQSIRLAGPAHRRVDASWDCIPMGVMGTMRW